MDEGKNVRCCRCNRRQDSSSPGWRPVIGKGERRQLCPNASCVRMGPPPRQTGADRPLYVGVDLGPRVYKVAAH